MSACPWKRLWNSDRNQYYYYLGNKSQWDVPEGFEEYFASQPDDKGDTVAAGAATAGSTSASAAAAALAPAAVPAAAADGAAKWRQVWQGEKPYYWRKLADGTRETTWDEPDDYIAAQRPGAPLAATPAPAADSAAAAAVASAAPAAAADAAAAGSAATPAAAASPSPTAAAASPSPDFLTAASPSPDFLTAASPPTDAPSPQLASLRSPDVGAGAGGISVGDGAGAGASPAYDDAQRSQELGEEPAGREDAMDVDTDAGGLVSPSRSPTFDFKTSPAREIAVDEAIAAGAVGREALESPRAPAAAGAAGRAAGNAAASAAKGKGKGPASAAAIDEAADRRRVAAIEAAMAEVDAMTEYTVGVPKPKDLERRDQDAVSRINYYVSRHLRFAADESANKAEKNAAMNRAGKAALERVKDLHVEHYRGYAANAMQLCDWLQWAQTDNDNDRQKDNEMFGEEDPAGPEAYEGEINSYLRDQLAGKFTDLKKVDEILENSKGVPPELEHMLNTSPYWRRLFLELYEKHPDSTFTRFTLNEISKKGHHDEIAAIVGEVPIFSVMNGVLRDRLSQVPAADSTALTGLLPDLKRICCSGVYSFIYSYEVLRCLELRCLALGRSADSDEEMSEAPGNGGGVNGSGVNGSSGGAGSDPALAEEALLCSRKFRRLRQELVAHASGHAGFCDAGYRGTAASAAEAAALRRQGATARTVHLYTELHKRKEARAQPRLVPIVLEVLENASANSGRGSGSLNISEAAGLLLCYRLEPLVAKAFEEPSSGSSGAGGSGPAEEAAAAVAAADAEAQQRGEVIQPRPSVDHLRDPVVMDLLMRTVFHQYSCSGSTDTLRRCCALIAYASCVDVSGREGSGDDGSNGGGGNGGKAAHAPGAVNGRNGKRPREAQKEETVDMIEVASVASALLEASEICVDARLVQQRDVQARLALAMDTPVVAAGVLVWVTSLLRSTDFIGASNFITMAPLLIKLSLRAAELHPLQRPAVFSVLKEMLAVNPGDVQARMKIKRQVLSGMLRLVASGYVVHVFDFTTSRCEAGALDHSLIRHFMGGLLRFAKPLPNGYSPVFLEVMANLLAQKSCHDALLSLSFPDSDKTVLGRFLGVCVSKQGAAMSPHCEEVMKKLQNALMEIPSR